MEWIIVYVSPNGTTKTTARLLKEEIERDGHSVQMFDLGRGALRYDPSPVYRALEQCDIALFGAPVYHMDMLTPMKDLFECLKKKQASYACMSLLFLNYAGITSGKALLHSVYSLAQAGLPVAGALKIAAPHFHHTPRFPDAQVKAAVTEFYREQKENQFRPIENRRYKELFAPEKPLVSFIYPFVHVIGKMRELSISLDQDSCRLCKKCERECPAGAISMSGKGPEINKAACIHCYHCTVSCPFGALQIPVGKLDSMIRMNKRIMGLEQPAHKIYI